VSFILSSGKRNNDQSAEQSGDKRIYFLEIFVSAFGFGGRLFK